MNFFKKEALINGVFYSPVFIVLTNSVLEEKEMSENRILDPDEDDYFVKV